MFLSKSQLTTQVLFSQRKRTVTFACYYERTNGDSQLARGKHNKIIRTDISSLMRLQRATLISSSKPNNATPKVSACEMQHELRIIQSENDLASRPQHEEIYNGGLECIYTLSGLKTGFHMYI